MNFHFLLCVAWLEWMAAGAQAACDVCVYVVENDIVLKEFDLERFFEGCAILFLSLLMHALLCFLCCLCLPSLCAMRLCADALMR